MEIIADAANHIYTIYGLLKTPHDAGTAADDYVEVGIPSALDVNAMAAASFPKRSHMEPITGPQRLRSMLLAYAQWNAGRKGKVIWTEQLRVERYQEASARMLSQG